MGGDPQTAGKEGDVKKSERHLRGLPFLNLLLLIQPAMPKANGALI